MVNLLIIIDIIDMDNENQDQKKRKDQYKSSAIHFSIGVLGILGMALYHFIST